MPRQRFDNLEPDRREAILAAAGEEFAANGYAGASLSRIIRAAGISKGSLYYYFENKADLFSSVIEEAVGRMVDDVGGLGLARLERSNFWDAVREYGRASVDLMRQDVWYVRLGMAFYRLREDPEAEAAVQPALEWSRSLMRDLLLRGRELEVVRSDLPVDLLVALAMAVDEAGGRWMLEHMAGKSDPELQELVDAQIDVLRDMLDARNEGWES